MFAPYGMIRPISLQFCFGHGSVEKSSNTARVKDSIPCEAFWGQNEKTNKL